MKCIGKYLSAEILLTRECSYRNIIFDYCYCLLFLGTLKWTRYQNSHHYPSPRKWHAIIPITARYRKGDNSVRTKSLPYLQKKGQNKIVTRPRSSPVYSSARLPRKSPEAVESIPSNRPITLPLKMTNDTSQVNSTSQPIEMTDLHNRNSDRRSPYKGNGFSENNSKQAEDISPLLANRQLSRDSVASNNSSLGTDNPCLELDSSCEKLDNFENRCCDDSKFLVSFELKDFSDKKETMSSANSEKQLVTRYVKNNKQMFHTSHIPGQVNLSPPKTETLYKKVSIDQNTGSDLIVEDLELCDNYFSINSQHGDHRHQRFTHVNRKKHSSNQDLKIKNSSDSEFCETEFYGRTHVKRENHLEEKSYSMNDITKTHLIQNDSLASRSRSMHVPQLMSYRKCNLNCWMEEAENSNEDDSLTPVDVDNGITVASQVLIDDVKETDTQTKKVQERDKEVIIEVKHDEYKICGVPHTEVPFSLGLSCNEKLVANY